jgi:adenylate cyclase
MARLILATAEGQQIVDLKAVNTIGRHPNNSIQLLDKIVSKEHCIIEYRVDHYVLRDLGSLNGTLVNGERVNGEMRLKNGDDISMGSTRAKFEDNAPRSGSGPYAAAAPLSSVPAQPAAAYQRVQPPPSVPAHSPLARSSAENPFRAPQVPPTPVAPTPPGPGVPAAPPSGTLGATRVEVQAQERDGGHRADQRLVDDPEPRREGARPCSPTTPRWTSPPPRARA